MYVLFVVVSLAFGLSLSQLGLLFTPSVLRLDIKSDVPSPQYILSLLLSHTIRYGLFLNLGSSVSPFFCIPWDISSSRFEYNTPLDDMSRFCISLVLITFCHSRIYVVFYSRVRTRF